MSRPDLDHDDNFQSIGNTLLQDVSFVICLDANLQCLMLPVSACTYWLAPKRNHSTARQQANETSLESSDYRCLPAKIAGMHEHGMKHFALRLMPQRNPRHWPPAGVVPDILAPLKPAAACLTANAILRRPRDARRRRTASESVSVG